MNASKETICVRTAREAIPNLTVLWSSGSTWHGITAEGCRLEEVETPQFWTVDHNLLMHLSNPALVELKTNGHLDARERVTGDLSILPAASVCQVRTRDPHEVLLVSVSHDLVAQTSLEAGDGTPCEIIPRVYYRDAQLQHICWALKAEAECNYASGRLYGESLALALCAHLLRQPLANDSAMARKGGMAPRALRRVIDYIESNLESSIQMSSLAEVSGLSQYRFAHNFKSATGIPPHQYVIRARLDRAKQMLRGSNLSVLDIAYGVGFQSISRFNSLFKRELGTTPSNYRASFR